MSKNGWLTSYGMMMFSAMQTKYAGSTPIYGYEGKVSYKEAGKRLAREKMAKQSRKRNR